jgi:hypothetical protein
MVPAYDPVKFLFSSQYEYTDAVIGKSNYRSTP